MNQKVKDFLRSFLINLPLIIGAIIMLAPLLWMLSTALKPNSFVASTSIIPKEITFENFIKAWEFPRVFNPDVTMGTFILNSLFVTIVITVFGIIIDSMAGYVLARKRFPGRNLFLYTALATMMVPFYVTLVPEYLIVVKFGWINTYIVQIVPFLASGMGIYLFRNHFMSIPIELEECAKIDGASDLRIYTSIMLPIAKPVVATMAIFKGMWSWNQYIWPLVINKIELKPIQLGLTMFKGLNVTQWGYLCAAMTIAILPLIILFISMQRHFIGDLTAGSVKG